MRLIRSALLGTSVGENPIPNITAPVAALPGLFRKRPANIPLDEERLSRNLLFLGGTGTGKTNTIFLLLDQILSSMTEDDVMIIFDTKKDFYKQFHRPGREDCVLANSGEFSNNLRFWNLFSELIVDGNQPSDTEQAIDEISRALFADRSSTQQPFFSNAARSLFVAWLTAMTREARKDPSFRAKHCSNKKLREYFNNPNPARFLKIAESFPDLAGISAYLGDGQNLQALGVIGELSSMVLDVFHGAFAKEGDFSIRNFIRNKGGKILFLEYDVAAGESLAPMYSLLIDLALKEALSQERSKGKVYFVLDELKLLPNLHHLDDAVNFGRSMGVRVFAGLQSLSQIYAQYGEQRGRAVVAGFSSLISFRPNDDVSRTYVREHFGKNFCEDEMIGSDTGSPPTRLEGWTVEDWNLSALQKGDAVIGLADHPPFLFHFDEFKP